MLLKKNRLTRLEVEEIKRRRTNPISSQYFGLVKLQKVGEPKFAVLISNKTAKSAVVRNHIRRTVYNTIQPILNNQQGWYLFLAKKSIIDAKQDEVSKEIIGLLR